MSADNVTGRLPAGTDPDSLVDFVIRSLEKSPEAGGDWYLGNCGFDFRNLAYLYERMLAGCRLGLVGDADSSHTVDGDPVELASRKRAELERARIRNLIPALEFAARYWRENAEPVAGTDQPRD